MGSVSYINEKIRVAHSDLKWLKSEMVNSDGVIDVEQVRLWVRLIRKSLDLIERETEVMEKEDM